MGDPKALLDAGKLGECREVLFSLVRSDPSNAKARNFLYQVLCITGDWDRALQQLNIATELDSANLFAAEVYRRAIQAEIFRERVFAGKADPLIFGDPLEWIAGLLHAIKVLVSGRRDAAEDLRSEAFDAAPAVPGSLDGEPFEWVADADSRLGPLLEAIVDGKYFWVPMQRVSRIDLEPPTELRDLVWKPAHFVWSNGGEAMGLIPTRYVGSHAHDDDAVKLARKTQWDSHGDRTFIGMGQRMLLTDSKDRALLDVRRIEWQPDDASSVRPDRHG